MSVTPSSPDEITPSLVNEFWNELLGDILGVIDRLLERRRQEHRSAKVIEHVRESVFTVDAFQMAFAKFDPERGTWKNRILGRVSMETSSYLRKVTENYRLAQGTQLDPDVDREDQKPKPKSEQVNPFELLQPAVEQLKAGERSCWTLRRIVVRLLLDGDKQAMQVYSERERALLLQLLVELTAVLLERRVDEAEKLKNARGEVETRTFEFHQITLNYEQQRRSLQSASVSKTTISDVEKLAGSLTAEQFKDEWPKCERKLISTDVQRAQAALHEFARTCQRKHWVHGRLEAAWKEFQKQDEKEHTRPTNQEMAKLLDKSISAIEAALNKADKAIKQAVAELRKRLSDELRDEPDD